MEEAATEAEASRYTVLFIQTSADRNVGYGGYYRKADDATAPAKGRYLD